MIRALFWKEWHEHRSKYLGYWFTLHAPLLLLIFALAFLSTSRVPFHDLSDATAIKYLPLTLVQPLLVATLFLLFTGYLAVATFSPEVEDRSLFFILEQPVSRTRYLALKLLNGACHVLLASACAILLFPAAIYLVMLISGKVTLAGSSGAFALVMAAAARSAVWCALISLAGFTASAAVSALVPKWWIAAICSVALTVLMIGVGGDFFSFFPPSTPEPISVGMSFSTDNSPWVTISRAVTPAELSTFAPWKPLPLLTAALLSAVFCAATTLLYKRKELK